MRDGMRRSFHAHSGEKKAAEKAHRIEQVAAICDAFRRGGIAVDRALAEIIDTARGDAAAVVRVGDGHNPELKS